MPTQRMTRLSWRGGMICLSGRIKQTKSAAAKKRSAYDNLYAEQQVAELFLKHRDNWFSVADVHQFPHDIGISITRGTLRNILWRLRSREFLESRRSSFAEYHLLRIPHEPHPMVGGLSLRPMIVRFGFAEYLESLNWEDLRNVHNLHLKASVRNLSFINKDWKYSKGQKAFSRNELVDNRYRITLTVFSRVRTLAVVVGCSKSPMAVDVEGLTRFHEVLCDMRAKYLDPLSVPRVCDWVVTQWHYGRDSKSSTAGLDFEVTFLDWFGNLVRIYTKGAAGSKVRMERIETPNETVASILDSAERTLRK